MEAPAENLTMIFTTRFCRLLELSGESEVQPDDDHHHRRVWGDVRHLADSGGDRDQQPRDVGLPPGPGPGGEAQPRLPPPPSLRPGKGRVEGTLTRMSSH